jgi:hypothetical protein
MNNTIAYKFVDWDVEPLETLQNTEVYKLKTKLLSGEKLNRAEKDQLYYMLHNNSYSTRNVPLRGWMFNFEPWLNRYWVKSGYGDITEVYAPDKTCIRKNWGCKINKILKVKK